MQFRFDHSYQLDAPPSFSTNFIAPTSFSTDAWYPDSGATHHLTNDLSNLNISSKQYTGNEQIRVGDDITLPIQHSNDSFLSSHSSTFKLYNLLHVPSITKNLISVCKFCAYNHCFFEFHDTFFVMKDKVTHPEDPPH